MRKTTKYSFLESWALLCIFIVAMIVAIGVSVTVYDFAKWFINTIKQVLGY